jgi:hypothetical protein
MSLQILYNNKDAFSGIAPIPFVSISQDYTDFGTIWNQVTNITLEGQLTGRYLGQQSYNLLYDASQKLLENFKQNYKSLSIKENGVSIYETDIAIINSINIDESSWYGLLPFTIELSVYNQNLFQDYYGVVEPEETFSFQEEENDILTLNHSISAKGIVTNNFNAIENAKNWVTSKINNFQNINPVFIQKASAFLNRPYLLYSSQEIIDRFNGTYTRENIYKKSLNFENPNNSLLNYTIDLNSGIEDGIISASINGSLEGNNLNILRTEYNNLNLYNLCSKPSFDIFREPLSTRAVSQSVDEINEENKLNFSASFNNDYSDEIINDYNIDINEDSLKCIRTVNLSATISCRYGDLATKWQKVQDFYKTKFYPYNLMWEEFRKEYPNQEINATPITESVSFDQFNAQIVFNAQYSDKKIILSSDILNASVSVNFEPSVIIHAANPSAFVSREHNIQNIRCTNRSKLDISVTAVAKINKSIDIAQSVAILEINKIKNNYSIFGKQEVLENRIFSKNDDLKSVTINETWSFNGPIIS